MKTRTILIVDDQLINRSILRKLLQSEYHILEADNGQTALAIMREYAADISAVLLDIVMPVLDGYGVLTAMQADPLLSKIPVIVSSQKDGDEAEEKALKLGAQDFIAKPYKANIIHHRLNNTIRFRETAAMINRVEKDELTGLLSKQFFFEQVSDLLHQDATQKYALASIGIEHFKLVNDIYGVPTGDNLLRHIAAVLNGSPMIALSARFFADHFYLLLPRCENYAENLFRPIVAQIHAFPIELDLNINCGIYQIEDIGTSVSNMCDWAQLAADLNKGHFDTLFSIYDDSMRQKLLNEQFIVSNMRTALSEKQFQVYYQPKYDLHNEMIAGAEALVRWIHPTKGFLSPGEFIPLFEHNGFITQLDEYVWETACRDIQQWIAKGYTPVAVSVNVSRADVYNPKLTDTLLSLIAKYQIPIRFLHLEITESAYTSNTEQIIKVVGNLRKLGFVIEMDDFGSGYSSLNMLSEMPVDVLKLDMGFVQHETCNASGKGIMSFVISLAKWLNLAVVAEGVETASQIATLRSMDCNYVQGFYYARPMKKDDFEQLMARNHVTEMICSSQTATEYIQKAKPIPGISSDRVMLIVDDIELNRAVLASTFDGWFVIVEQENGKTAWDYLQAHADQVAIVLLDLLMPVMDGFHLLEKIRADERTAQLPVIITSQGDSDSELRAMKMQADDFISKPYNPEVVQRRVCNAIEVRYLHQLQQNNSLLAVLSKSGTGITDGLTQQQKTLLLVSALTPYFDIVRLVDPDHTFVYPETDTPCDVHSCYSVWGKSGRCNNCISLKSLQKRERYCKLEYSGDSLYFVIAQYVPYGAHGAVMELVSKLEDSYVDNVLDKQLLYARLDALNQQLSFDTLTGVFNRRYLDNNLDKFISSTRSRQTDLGVAMVDLDEFKLLNDQFGHQCGDEALCTAARMLRDNIAQSKGDFVARYGGDEFIVVCRDIPKNVFSRRLAAVSKLIRYVKTADGTEIPLSISAGCVSLSEFPDGNGQKLIYEADQRLYQAKAKGHGSVVSADEKTL